MLRNLFIDMDGTIARFHEHQDFEAAMWKKDFFLHLRPYQNVLDALNLLLEEGNNRICILSAAPSSPSNIQQQKITWLKKYLPGIRQSNILIVDSGTPKSEFMLSKGDILLDDYNKNLRDWEQNGGISIKLVNEINDVGTNGPLWEGLRIHYEDSPEAIARILKVILNSEDDLHSLAARINQWTKDTFPYEYADNYDTFEEGYQQVLELLKEGNTEGILKFLEDFKSENDSLEVDALILEIQEVA